MLKRSFVFAAVLLGAFGLSACSSSTTPTPPPAPQSLYAADRNTGKLFVYALPASAAATPAVTVTTGFADVYDVVWNSGSLWIDNDLSPTVVYGYNLPLTSASIPVTTVNSTGTSNAFSFAFDPSGNLWLADENNGRVLGYHGPFSGTSTPASFTSLTTGQPWNVISDTTGDLYVASGAAVVRFNAPPTSVNLTLSTLVEPIAMQLDGAGDLYVGDFNNGNLYRYNAPITNAEAPSITDLKANTTLNSPYYMALDNAGNLYVSDCSGSIKVFVTSTFSATSTPAYTLPLPGGACSTGLAIH